MKDDCRPDTSIQPPPFDILTNAPSRSRLHSLVGWLRRIFKRPRYCIGWDKSEGADYWVKMRFNHDGTIDILDHGRNEHKPANATGERPETRSEDT